MRPDKPVSHRKYLLIPVVAAVFATSLVSVSSAQAVGTIPLNIVGTSDVQDSGLMDSVITPGFEAAYPQYNVSYLAQGSGTAIKTAESGKGDESLLIVHAASLENQFVASGYSAESAGRAVFWGDYVLLGPANDPAGVLTSAPHDIATAFEKIAAAGAAGNAEFISRNDKSGTNVEEHVVWGLTGTTSLCTVSTANGGGSQPSTTTGDCPSTAANPAWYVLANQSSQAANVVATESDAAAGKGAYTLTDRGTYANLLAQGKISNLKIATRDNAATARGGATALVNTFHAYAVNAAAVPAGTNINTQGATDFLNWLTSPAAQAAVANYLKPAAGSTDTSPFLPSAAPAFTASTLPTSVKKGASITVTGTLANVVPGTPALAGKTVTLQSTPTATSTAAPTAVATATTDATGAYSITYKPTATATYSLATPASTQLEYPTLTPTFSDLLAAGSKALSTVTVKPTTKVGLSKITYYKAHSEKITVHIVPNAGDKTGVVTFYGRHTGNSGTKLFKLKTIKVPAGKSTVSFTYNILPLHHSWKTRTWKIKFTYSGTNIQTSTSSTKTLHLK
jgi:tungstate transport system substrate-binding protein